MPFQRQQAGKSGHADFMQNPDVEAFWTEHKDVPRPTADALGAMFAACPKVTDFTGVLPNLVMALDGSLYEGFADQREPSRRMGYIKVGMIAMDMQKYQGLSRAGHPYVDPMAVNRLQTSTALSMALPGAHVKRPEYATVEEGYRHYIQRYFMSDRTCFRGAHETLLDTLVDLLRMMGESGFENGQEYTTVGICPDADCEAKNIHVPVDTHMTGCPECGTRVLTVDTLRLHECFVESGSNEQAYNRLMLAAEHLLAAHSLRHLRQNNLSLIARMAIVMDGPLSVNGEPATIHKGIMQLVHDINVELKAQGFGPAIMMGLTKSGFAVDHFAGLDQEIPANIVFPVNDDYRYEYIAGKPHDGTKPFGDRTYYGQDFLVKTPTGHQFLICMAYPWAKKTDAAFKSERFDPAKYEALGTALALVTTLESDLYTNSMVPVILAHEYASISLAPGGKVLDLATARAVGSA